MRLIRAEHSKGKQSIKYDSFVSQCDARDREHLFESRRQISTLSSNICVVNCINLFYYKKVDNNSDQIIQKKYAHNLSRHNKIRLKSIFAVFKKIKVAKLTPCVAENFQHSDAYFRHSNVTSQNY